jgi:hypothetical protein
MGQPSWGFGHRLVPGHSNATPPGLSWFTLQRVAHYCRRPLLFG